MTYLEIIDHVPDRAAPRHVVLDHDGTLSTIRYNWESIMEPMMLDAIVGDTAQRHALYVCGADTGTEALDFITNEVREFIDRTTGIQTLRQMQGLVEMVQKWCINSIVLDAFGYKKIYNDRLMSLVNSRLEPLQRGFLNVADFEVKNASQFLARLRGNGCKLHLASGTDQDDVTREAGILGYAGDFEGRIHGSVNKLEIEAKQVVLQRILEDVKQSVVVIGDGPVEIQEGRKVGAYTVGVASDECRRHGLNPRKRKRLIEAGAHVIIPDFSNIDLLIDHLFHATHPS